MTQAESQQLTPFQVRLAGEEMGRYHQKSAFLEKVFVTACEFLELKPYNSVRIVFRLHLEDPLARAYPLGSPAVVRMRFARLAAAKDEIRVEWRLASARSEDSHSHANLTQIDNPMVVDRRGQTPTGFLGQEFGQGVVDTRWHFRHVSKIEADLVLREPLGTLAVMKGSSALVKWYPTGLVDSHSSLLRLDDDPALREP